MKKFTYMVSGDLSFEYEPLSELTVHYSGKTKVAKGKNACYLVRKGSEEGCLDKALFEQAKNLGVKINFNCNSRSNYPLKYMQRAQGLQTSLQEGQIQYRLR